ncbi:hypothetical protein UFOVP276_190 [uncultured Caudovirales phage]|uniref:Uncharacterized protein n=1 Tax=uncultured Caudovirales phage TaxID=2100421 RepID=A0A6J5LIF8_9CAUD|nr:hypothetical protein UFOVP127_84 [uncultured Caudovirales phage]CAB4135234.1 hypothetical protein UFOVP276_190 [uncultured Caudovirales phage]
MSEFITYRNTISMIKKEAESFVNLKERYPAVYTVLHRRIEEATTKGSSLLDREAMIFKLEGMLAKIRKNYVRESVG